MSDESKKVPIKAELTELAFPEITQVQLNDSLKQLVEVMPEHAGMLETIKSSLPEIHRATSLFFKSQSQFMDNMLTVSHMTPLRNLRQILAQMTRTRDAIKESHHKMAAKNIELEEKHLEIEYLENKLRRADKGGLKIGKIRIFNKNEDDLEQQYSRSKDLLRIKALQGQINQILSEAETAKGYISGAIRQLANYTENYESIRKEHGIMEFSEEDFENEEEKYHIMKAFEQGLCAARARGGAIDEGNMIYFTQIGVNGAHAQYRLLEYLKQEQELLQDGKAPTHKTYRDFLENMVNEFKGTSLEFAKAKGMRVQSEIALLGKGDDRLLKKKGDGT